MHMYFLQYNALVLAMQSCIASPALKRLRYDAYRGRRAVHLTLHMHDYMRDYTQ